MNFIKPAALAAALLVAGCGAMPHHAEIREQRISKLIFLGGPEGGTVSVDGAEVGHIAGKKTIIPVADGTHSVSVTWNGTTVYSQAVFIVDGTQKIVPLTK